MPVKVASEIYIKYILMDDCYLSLVVAGGLKFLARFFYIVVLYLHTNDFKRCGTRFIERLNEIPDSAGRFQNP